MRRTRLVILPGAKCLTQMCCLLLYLACPNIGALCRQQNDASRDDLCNLGIIEIEKRNNILDERDGICMIETRTDHDTQTGSNNTNHEYKTFKANCDSFPQNLIDQECKLLDQKSRIIEKIGEIYEDNLLDRNLESTSKKNLLQEGSSDEKMTKEIPNDQRTSRYVEQSTRRTHDTRRFNNEQQNIQMRVDRRSVSDDARRMSTDRRDVRGYLRRQTSPETRDLRINERSGDRRVISQQVRRSMERRSTSDTKDFRRRITERQDSRFNIEEQSRSQENDARRMSTDQYSTRDSMHRRSLPNIRVAEKMVSNNIRRNVDQMDKRFSPVRNDVVNSLTRKSIPATRESMTQENRGDRLIAERRSQQSRSAFIERRSVEELARRRSMENFQDSRRMTSEIRNTEVLKERRSISENRDSRRLTAERRNTRESSTLKLNRDIRESPRNSRTTMGRHSLSENRVSRTSSDERENTERSFQEILRRDARTILKRQAPAEKQTTRSQSAEQRNVRAQEPINDMDNSRRISSSNRDVRFVMGRKLFSGNVRSMSNDRRSIQEPSPSRSIPEISRSRLVSDRKDDKSTMRRQLLTENQKSSDEYGQTPVAQRSMQATREVRHMTRNQQDGRTTMERRSIENLSENQVTRRLSSERRDVHESREQRSIRDTSATRRMTHEPQNAGARIEQQLLSTNRNSRTLSAERLNVHESRRQRSIQDISAPRRMASERRDTRDTTERRSLLNFRTLERQDVHDSATHRSTQDSRESRLMTTDRRNNRATMKERLLFENLKTKSSEPQVQIRDSRAMNSNRRDARVAMDRRSLTDVRSMSSEQHNVREFTKSRSIQNSLKSRQSTNEQQDVRDTMEWRSLLLNRNERMISNERNTRSIQDIRSLRQMVNERRDARTEKDRRSFSERQTVRTETDKQQNVRKSSTQRSDQDNDESRRLTRDRHDERQVRFVNRNTRSSSERNVRESVARESMNDIRSPRRIFDSERRNEIGRRSLSESQDSRNIRSERRDVREAREQRLLSKTPESRRLENERRSTRTTMERRLLSENRVDRILSNERQDNKKSEAPRSIQNIRESRLLASERRSSRTTMERQLLSENRDARILSNERQDNKKSEAPRSIQNIRESRRTASERRDARDAVSVSKRQSLSGNENVRNILAERQDSQRFVVRRSVQNTPPAREIRTERKDSRSTVERKVLSEKSPEHYRDSRNSVAFRSMKDTRNSRQVRALEQRRLTPELRDSRRITDINNNIRESQRRSELNVRDSRKMSNERQFSRNQRSVGEKIQENNNDHLYSLGFDSEYFSSAVLDNLMAVLKSENFLQALEQRSEKFAESSNLPNGYAEDGTLDSMKNNSSAIVNPEQYQEDESQIFPLFVNSIKDNYNYMTGKLAYFVNEDNRNALTAGVACILLLGRTAK